MRTMGVALSTLFISIPFTVYLSNKYNKYALKYKKLSLEQNEKQKIQQQEKIENDAIELIETLSKNFKKEITLLNNTTALSQENFEYVIKSKYNFKDTPFTHYLHVLKNSIEQLETIYSSLPNAEYKARGQELLSSLNLLLENFNVLLADTQKIEHAQVMRQERIQEDYARKREKELLEIEKLRSDIQVAAANKSLLSKVVLQIEVLQTRVEHIVNMVKNSNTLQELESIKRKQRELLDEINRQHSYLEKITSALHSLKNEFTNYKDFPISSGLPSFNPELVNEPALNMYIKPSAPPL